MDIRIETARDTSECDCCGTCYAEGGTVTIDGVLVLDRPPAAACYDGESYSESELLVMALAKMGHPVLVDGAPFHVTCHDPEYHGPQT